MLLILGTLIDPLDDRVILDTCQAICYGLNYSFNIMNYFKTKYQKL